MEQLLKYALKLDTNPEYKSLYSWSIQEHDQSGRKIGRDFIPWPWSLYFRLEDITYAIAVNSIGSKYAPESELAHRNNTIKLAETYIGDAIPTEYEGQDTTYSLMGSDTKIKKFGFRIIKIADAGIEEQCRFWAFSGYTTDWDFQKQTVPDSAGLEIYLTAEKFDQLRARLHVAEPSEIIVRLSEVDGFYSDWSPSIRTDMIKILVEQKVEMPEGCEITPPSTGHVGEVDVFFKRNQTFASSKGEEDLDEADEDTPSEQQRLQRRADRLAQVLPIEGMLAAQANRIENAVNRAVRPLWILVLLGLLLVLHRWA